MGIDSLLSLDITSRFAEELEMNGPLESIFTDCPTIGAIKVLFQADRSSTSSDDSGSDDDQNMTAALEAEISDCSHLPRMTRKRSQQLYPCHVPHRFSCKGHHLRWRELCYSSQMAPGPRLRTQAFFASTLASPS